TRTPSSRFFLADLRCPLEFREHPFRVQVIHESSMKDFVSVLRTVKRLSLSCRSAPGNDVKSVSCKSKKTKLGVTKRNMANISNSGSASSHTFKLNPWASCTRCRRSRIGASCKTNCEIPVE